MSDALELVLKSLVDRTKVACLWTVGDTNAVKNCRVVSEWLSRQNQHLLLLFGLESCYLACIGPLVIVYERL